jgi:hypothetical protein
MKVPAQDITPIERQQGKTRKERGRTYLMDNDVPKEKTVVTMMEKR